MYRTVEQQGGVTMRLNTDLYLGPVVDARRCRKTLPLPILIYFYSEEEFALRNKRTKKEDDYHKVESRGENGDWDRYKKRNSYSHDKHSKHEKPHRDELLKVQIVN